MGLSNDKEYLLKEVFTKVKYDSLSEKCIIHIEDYLPLNLTVNQLRLLDKMCAENDIVLERLPRRISYSEGERLLLEYHQLKERKNSIKNQKEKEELEEKLIELRNKIVLGYMELIYKIVNKSFADLSLECDREDIYQIGYLVLINFIDLYKPDKRLLFSEFLRTYALYKIIEEATITNRGFRVKSQNDLKKLKRVRAELKDDASIKKLMEVTGFSQERIKYLLSLEKATKDISLNELLSTSLVDDMDIERIVEEKIIKEHLVMLLEFLDEAEREILKLYYGFYDNKEHSLEEIAVIIGYNSKERVRQIKEDAIMKLRMPIYCIHISDGVDSESVLEDFINAKKSCFVKKRIDEYEIMLLLSLPREILDKMIRDLSPELKTSISLYLGLDGERYNINQISKMMNRNIAQTRRLIDSSLHAIKTRINNSTKKGNSKSEYYKYLTQKYFKRQLKR